MPGKNKKKKRIAGKNRFMGSFRKYLKLLFWFGIAVVVLVTLYALFLAKEISDRFNGRKWDIPSRVYSDSLVLYPGMNISKSVFEAKIKRLEYARVNKGRLTKGNYSEEGDSIIVHLRDFDYPRERFEGFPVRVTFENGAVSAIQMVPSGEQIHSFELEPEVIAEMFSKKMEERKILRLADVPEWLPKMLVSVEDRRFYDHFGIDLRSIGRAFLANIKRGRIVQGGSTITQQLVRNLFLHQKQTLWRKSVEAFMALILEALHTKDEIIEAYMNEVWMGQKGAVSVHGFGEASRFYFGKDAKYIGPLEGAMLVGMIKSAYVYSPYKFFDRAMERAKLTLKKAYEEGVISRVMYEDALRESVTVREYKGFQDRAPYFTGFIKRQLLELYPEKLLTAGGLRIFTTLDMDMQKSAVDAITDGLKEIERDYKETRRDELQKRLQSAFITVKPQTGYIKAYVGGRNFGESQFDRVSMAKRQPGSLFKPFVFLTAFNLSGDDGKYTPSSILDDSQLSIKYDGRVYEPKNYDEKYFGEVTFRTALEKSLNCATVRLGHEIGEKRIVEMIKRLGIQSEVKPYPSIALGSFEVTVMEMAQAYSVIANMGTRARVLSIKDVVNPDGDVLEKKTMQLERVLKPQEAFLINNILKGVFERGTGRVSRLWGFEGVGAGKTGTSDDYRDSWFVGYTPELLSLAWIGFDNNENTTLTGTSGALRIWSKFMKNLPRDVYGMDFRTPDGIEFADIDVQTGLLAGYACSDKVRESFVKGTRPKKTSDCRTRSIEVRTDVRNLERIVE